MVYWEASGRFHLTIWWDKFQSLWHLLFWVADVLKIESYSNGVKQIFRWNCGAWYHQRRDIYENENCFKFTSSFGMWHINEFWYQSSSWYCWSDAICFATFFPVFKVPYHIDEGQPSYLIIAGLVFTPLSEPLIEYVVFIIFQISQCLFFRFFSWVLWFSI